MRILYIKNPLKLFEREELQSQYIKGKTIREYCLDVNIDMESHRFILSGKVVDALDTPVNENDELVILPEIKDMIFTPAVIGALIATAKVLAVVGAIASVGYAVYSAINQPKKPSFGSISSGGLEESSPTYGWDGVKTTQNVGTPVPVIYGEMITGGNIVSEWVSSDGDKNYLNMLIAVAEGEIEEISDIKFNDNPSTNFEGITTIKRYGTNNQTTIDGFHDLHNEYIIDQQLTQGNAYTYTTVGVNVEAFEIEVELPAGLYEQDSTSGSLLSWSVTYLVEYKLHSSGTWIELGEQTISGKSRTKLRRYYRKDGLTAGQYDIRVTKMSADSDSFHISDLFLKNIDEITTETIVYNNTALLGIKALATEQLSGSQPNVSMVVKGKKVRVPQVMNGAVEVDWEDYYWDPSYSGGTGAYRLLSDNTVLSWDGSTYVDRWSANPIWCMRDFITNTRYGLGEYISSTNVNDTRMLQMSRYCDEKVPDGDGGYEKRFRMDVVLDSSTKATDLITQLAVSYNGFPFFSSGMIHLSIDKPEQYVQLFNMGNIVENSFEQSCKSHKETYNVIEVQYINKEMNWKQETIAYTDDSALAAGDSIRKKSIRVFCTKTSYAIRAARYALKVSKYINNTYRFKASIDAIACQPTDVISISHDVPQFGYSGRILSGSTTTTIKLDQSVTVALGTVYNIMIKYANDTIVLATVSNVPGTYTEITVDTALSTAPSAYDLYAFGPVNQVKKDARIISIEKSNENECSITCAEYNANVYDDSAVTLPDNNISSLLAGVPDVEHLVLTEGAALASDGTVKNAIEVWFEKPDSSGYAFDNRYREAKIYLSDDGGDSYEHIGSTTGASYVISKDIIVGNAYNVKVVSVSQNGMEKALGSAPTSNITITGRTEHPETVQNFTYTFGSILELNWADNIEGDLAGYEMRLSDSIWASGAQPLFKGLATKFFYSPSTRTPGTHYIRAFNTSGQYSETSATVTPTNSAPSAPTVTADVTINVARLHWTNVSDTDVIKYLIYKSDTNAWAGEETKVGETPGTSYTAKGNKSRYGIADSAASTTITDADLAGLGVNALVGDKVIILSGDAEGDERYISAYNNTTGQITVSSAFSSTPAANDKFSVCDVAYYKVSAVDTFGEGTKSSAVTVEYEYVDDDSLGIISVSKLFAAQLSAISANLGEVTAGIITGLLIRSASSGARIEFDDEYFKAYDGSGNVIYQINLTGTDVGDVIFGSTSNGYMKWDASAAKLIADKLQSSDYSAGTAGWKLSATDGLEVNVGNVNNSVVTKTAEASGSSSSSPYTLSASISAKGKKIHAWATVSIKFNDGGYATNANSAYAYLVIDGTTVFTTQTLKAGNFTEGESVKGGSLTFSLQGTRSVSAGTRTISVVTVKDSGSEGMSTTASVIALEARDQ